MPQGLAGYWRTARYLCPFWSQFAVIQSVAPALGMEVTAINMRDAGGESLAASAMISSRCATANVLDVKMRPLFGDPANAVTARA